MKRKGNEPLPENEEIEKGIFETRCGQAVMLITKLKGKSWANTEPRGDINAKLDVMRESLRSRNIPIIGVVELNRADESSWTGGETVYSVIGVDTSVTTEATDTVFTDTLEQMATTETSAHAAFTIRDSFATMYLGNYDLQKMYPLAIFANEAIKALGPDIVVSGSTLRGMGVLCSAVKR